MRCGPDSTSGAFVLCEGCSHHFLFIVSERRPGLLFIVSSLRIHARADKRLFICYSTGTNMSAWLNANVFGAADGGWWKEKKDVTSILLSFHIAALHTASVQEDFETQREIYISCRALAYLVWSTNLKAIVGVIVIPGMTAAVWQPVSPLTHRGAACMQWAGWCQKAELRYRVRLSAAGGTT